MATVPIWPLSTLKELVDPTPTRLTFNISSSILKSDFAEIFEISFKKTDVLPTPTVVARPTEITVVIPTGLWITLSILINDLIEEFIGGTENECVCPIPAPLVNETPIPEFAKLAATATLIVLSSSLIAKTVDGNRSVKPIPVTLVVAIPMGWLLKGL